MPFLLQEVLSLQDKLKSKEAELEQVKEEHRCLEAQMQVLQAQVCPHRCRGDESKPLACSQLANRPARLQLLSPNVEAAEGSEPRLQVPLSSTRPLSLGRVCVALPNTHTPTHCSNSNALPAVT